MELADDRWYALIASKCLDNILFLLFGEAVFGLGDLEFPVSLNSNKADTEVCTAYKNYMYRDKSDRKMM